MANTLVDYQRKLTQENRDVQRQHLSLQTTIQQMSYFTLNNANNVTGTGSLSTRDHTQYGSSTVARSPVLPAASNFLKSNSGKGLHGGLQVNTMHGVNFGPNQFMDSHPVPGSNTVLIHPSAPNSTTSPHYIHPQGFPSPTVSLQSLGDQLMNTSHNGKDIRDTQITPPPRSKHGTPTAIRRKSHFPTANTSKAYQ